MVEYLANLFSSSSGGINTELENAAILAGRAYTPGATIDSSFGFTKNDSAAKINYNYQIHYQFGRSLISPPEFTITYQDSGTCNTPLASTTGSQSGNYVLTGLDTVSTYYTLSGSSITRSTQKSKHYNISFTCNSQYSIYATMNKNYHTVHDGQALIAVSGTGPSNESFYYSIVFTFIGNNETMLQMNGVTYYIDLSSGIIGP